MPSPRSSARGIGVVAVLALAVGLATLHAPAPLRTLPPDGVWMFEDSLGTETRIVHIGIWPGYVQYVETPASFGPPALGAYNKIITNLIYYNFSNFKTGIIDKNQGALTVRFYEPIDRDWENRGDTTGMRFEVAEPVSFHAIERRDGSWRLVEGAEVYRLRRLPTGPRPRRFSIRTSACFGWCSELSLEVDARGHVEYEGFRKVPRIGRFMSDDGAKLFRTLKQTAALARPDSIRYRSSGDDGQVVDVVIDYENGQRVSQSVMWLENDAYHLFALEVYRLLPTLALAPTTRPHRFATDSDEER